MTSINFDEIEELGSVGLDFDTAAALIDNMPTKIQKMVWRAAFYYLYLDEQSDPETEHVETMIPAVDKKSIIAAELWEILKEAVDTSRQGMSIAEKSEDMIQRAMKLNKDIDEMAEREPDVPEIMYFIHEEIEPIEVRTLLWKAAFEYVYQTLDDEMMKGTEMDIRENALASRVWDIFKKAIAREMPSLIFVKKK